MNVVVDITSDGFTIVVSDQQLLFLQGAAALLQSRFWTSYLLLHQAHHTFFFSAGTLRNISGSFTFLPFLRARGPAR